MEDVPLYVKLLAYLFVVIYMISVTLESTEGEIRTMLKDRRVSKGDRVFAVALVVVLSTLDRIRRHEHRTSRGGDYHRGDSRGDGLVSGAHPVGPRGREVVNLRTIPEFPFQEGSSLNAAGINYNTIP